MPAEYTTFGLAPATRPEEIAADGGHRLHRDFVDFVVDGRPLLFRLADLDAVSPLASDVPPAILAAQVRGLLLESEAPLPGGRYLIYGCPECEDLVCGAVTAVIERAHARGTGTDGTGTDGTGTDGSGTDGADGADYVWRDFAWQTDAHADLERDGYHGIGPFRFAGAEYRAALRSLLDGDGGGHAPRRRVLLVGARAAALARLAAALRALGISGDTVHIHAGELRQYGAVVFGTGVGPAERAAVRDAFERAGADVARVDGTPAIVPLLVARIEQALDPGPVERRRLKRLTAAGGAADVEVTSACRVRLTAHRLDRLHRTRTQELFDGVLEPGRHRLALDARAVKGESFVVARTAGGVLVAAVAHGEPPGHRR
ncbi:oxidoreductase [Streptomyces sp. NPDC088770]|uniref:oxidoreductase n=1 Tax=Streptomyces sp. NPDC088770 TaxID=3365895 RepID=UPI00382D26EA